MIRNGEISKSEAKRVLRKYWWVLPLTVIAGTLLAFAVTLALPKRFTSQTTVLVDQPTVSPELVKPVITEQTNQRLTSMQEQILSRSRLETIIAKFGLYPSERRTLPLDEVVLKLRSAIETTPLEQMQGSPSRQFPGFHINVTFADPQTAQRICSEVTTMFLQESAKYVETQGTLTTEFLDQQLEESKQKLDEQDAKLAKFKNKYMGSLPDNEQANLGLLTTLNSQLDANVQAISRAQQDKVVNESLLASQLAEWKAVKSGETPAETLDQQLSALQDQLGVLLSRYTPDHPDVIKTKTQIEQLKKRIWDAPTEGSAPASGPTSGHEPASVQQLRARLRLNDLGMADLMKRQGQIQGQITVLQGKLQSTPAVEQQYKELTRDYQTALEGYNELLRHRDQAAMGRALNRQQQGELLRVLDPPSLPVSPSFPKVPLFAGVGAAIGLAAGLGILYLIAALDSSMHTERDVETCLNLPVLALVPNVAAAGRALPNPSKETRLSLAGTRDRN
jgi:polysaccharide chain length determinant protein (PEP-CTERM system associated)